MYPYDLQVRFGHRERSLQLCMVRRSFLIFRAEFSPVGCKPPHLPGVPAPRHSSRSCHQACRLICGDRSSRVHMFFPSRLFFLSLPPRDASVDGLVAAVSAARGPGIAVIFFAALDSHSRFRMMSLVQGRSNHGYYFDFPLFFC